MNKNINPSRRHFLQAAAASAASLAAPVHATSAQAARGGTSRTAGAYLKDAGGSLVLGNAHVEFGFDLRSGALIHIENKATRRRIQISPDAAAPVRIRCGSRDGSREVDAVICRAGGQRTDHTVMRSEAETVLRFAWDDLPIPGGRSGISLACDYALAADTNYVRVRTELQNRGSLWIRSLTLGLEGLSLSQDPATERLLVGDVFGKPYDNPRRGLKEAEILVKIPAGQRTFSIPSTLPIGLIMGWMDYSAGGSGLGLGYLDRSEIDLVGRVESRPEGLALGWRLFRLEGSRAFMWGYNGADQVYPLAPGEQFTSDEWMIVCHDGDWHKTADAYRERYEAAFRDDFTDWARTSPAVKQNDIIFNTHIAWGAPSKDRTRAYDYPNGRVFNRFADIAPGVRRAIELIDVAPANVIVNVLGTATEWGIYKMPDHFPMVEQAGGQAAAEDMCRQLNAMGIGGINMYAHPYFMHREARNYVAAADTGMNYPHRDWHTSMGGIACIAADGWQQLWTQRILPQFAAMGVRALYMDEGFGHQFICTKADHGHGTSALAVLTAQSRGATSLYRAWRTLAGPQAFLSCEGGSDVQARWIDLWHFDPTEPLRYTHPDKMMMTGFDAKDIPAGIGRALIFGSPLMVVPLNAPYGNSPLQGNLLEVLRRFVALRRELREKKAPGYPHAFRDVTGLSEFGDLAIKSFADRSGITLAYFAPGPYAGEIVVDAARLGHPRLGRLRRGLKLAAAEMGYITL